MHQEVVQSLERSLTGFLNPTTLFHIPEEVLFVYWESLGNPPSYLQGRGAPTHILELGWWKRSALNRTETLVA